MPRKPKTVENKTSIPESRRYGVHFDYKDLVKRLLKLKAEKEKSYINRSFSKLNKTYKVYLEENFSRTKSVHRKRDDTPRKVFVRNTSSGKKRTAFRSKLKESKSPLESTYNYLDSSLNLRKNFSPKKRLKKLQQSLQKTNLNKHVNLPKV